MNTKEKPRFSEEPRNTAFKQLEEEVCEEKQRRGQYVVNGDDKEPPGRGHYVVGVDKTEIIEEIKSIEDESTTP